MIFLKTNFLVVVNRNSSRVITGSSTLVTSTYPSRLGWPQTAHRHLDIFIKLLTSETSFTLRPFDTNMQFLPGCATLATNRRTRTILSPHFSFLSTALVTLKLSKRKGLQVVLSFVTLFLTVTVNFFRSRSPEKWCCISLMISFGFSCSDQVLSKSDTLTMVPDSVSMSPLPRYLGFEKYSWSRLIFKPRVFFPSCFVWNSILLAQAR